jgi:hypothetical protein
VKQVSTSEILYFESSHLCLTISLSQVLVTVVLNVILESRNEFNVAAQCSPIVEAPTSISNSLGYSRK